MEALLRMHRGKLITLADNLLKRSSLSRKEVLSILEPQAPAQGNGQGQADEHTPAPSRSELELMPKEQEKVAAS